MTLDLFDPPTIRTEAPSAPGSASSAEAASLVTEPMRTRSYRLIFTALAAHGLMSREQLSSVTGQKESSLCARLSELRPTWVVARSGAIVAASGCRVDGYELTAVGRRRFEQGNEPRRP